MLLVDDEPLLVHILGKLLSEVHQVDLATSAKDALDRLLGAPLYDVIFCDVRMPRMNGLDFFDEVTRRNPAQARRIVFLTGGLTDAALQARLASAELPVLEKPVDYRVLLRLADEYLGACRSQSRSG